MSIPVALQSFKSAGVYRIVYDKSTVLNQDTQIMRLVVGYSPQGPFNTPVLVSSISEFKSLYGEGSKSLEKRGIYFHRLALQALLEGPILCLNLKKFDKETVGGADISTNFNDNAAITDAKFYVEDIYDTARFWELSAFKLAEINNFDGKALPHNYIAISATNTKDTSCSVFIRKASGNKVAGYNVTVSDWYRDSGEEVPEYLQNKLNNYMSDFFAEIYVFRGKFEAAQVLTSETLKNYFEVKDNKSLQLRPYVYDAYGDATDTLDALYNDSTSGALSHYVGSLIPYFKDKSGVYQSLDILFNTDVDTNNLMMNFNVDLLDDESKADVLDLSGRTKIADGKLADIYSGKYKTSLLGNEASIVIADKILFRPEYNEITNYKGTNSLRGNYYVSTIGAANSGIHDVTFKDIKDDKADTNTFTMEVKAEDLDKFLSALSIKKTTGATTGDTYSGGAYCAVANDTTIPELLVTDITGFGTHESKLTYAVTDNESTTYAKFITDSQIYITSYAKPLNTGVENVYGSSISFIPVSDYTNTVDETKYVSTKKTVLNDYFAVGDCVLGDADGTNVYVQEIGNEPVDPNAKDGATRYYVKFTGKPKIYEDAVNNTGNYLVRIDNPLNQEIGTMKPLYLEGYTYNNLRPASTSMYDKQNWQDFILSTLTDYKGIRTGLLNKSDIDYRYVIDTFETYVCGGAKKVLSYLCKEKQSAFAILNFPSVRTFVKCPYTSFTDAKGIFNANYVVKGYNPKKPHSIAFSLPNESDGASFCAFYTPLKFTDGYIDTMVPSAALVSNLFIEKYRSRQPYYIVAGPNYGNITASGMTGPDYNYSREELNILEPYGVNCMVYRPGFGTFINANQTAKQSPKSALSSVNVRELVIYLQDEIEKLLQSYQWEFNNQTVRNKIKDKADVICARVQHNGGIVDYLNVMDESNNTPDIIDNEYAVLSTHIEAGRGCGKMVHELTLYRTGQMRSSITEA